MGLTRNDSIFAVIVGLLMLGGKKAFAAMTSSHDDGSDGAKLLARANQQAALAWVPIFASVHVEAKGTHPTISDAMAHAYARWAGVESSGNPITSSRIDERGLMQVGPKLGGPDTVPPPPAFGQAEWVALTDPETHPDEQAAMAIHYVDWLYGRALKYIADPPSDPVDQVWYAKLYHQRPVDLRDGKLHGPAIPMARELAKRWANDSKAMHRLRAANVVAFGVPTP